MMNQLTSQNMTRSDVKLITPEATLKLASSASEQNVYFTYVCLVNDVLPKNLSKQPYGYIDGDIEEVDQEDVPIKVERSKALHELIESHRHDSEIEERNYNETGPSSTYQTATSCDETDASETENAINFDTANPNVLKLTKMKWLTEEQDDSPDSSSPCLTPSLSSTSSCSHDSDEMSHDVGDKYLSTILRLDREHNMFGLSNIAIVESNIARSSRKIRKEDEKPVFPQTAIVQICCGKNCCRHRSKTDLPASLKCGGCHNCCVDPFCPSCIGPCDTSCAPQPKCPPLCSSCPKGNCSCKVPCMLSKCMLDGTTCFGMKISLNRKPKYNPAPVELTPRSSCVLDKPFAARSCHHIPRCIPPSSCFPYLMPCFWPARPSAPCSVPARCFHKPPCLAPRKPRQGNLPERCPPGICADPKYPGTNCRNMTCPGKSLQLKEGLEQRFKKDASDLKSAHGN